MTNGHGKSKYHYCSQQGDQVCETRVPPPQSENCQKFLDSDQSKELSPDSDVAIMSNGTTSMCYVDRGSNYGWCSVYEDAAHMKSFRYLKGLCGCKLSKQMFRFYWAIEEELTRTIKVIF